jgi:hypothetical protein
MLSSYQAVGLLEGFYEANEELKIEAIEFIADEFINDKCSYDFCFPRTIDDNFRGFI